MDGTPAAHAANTQQARLQALYAEMRPHGLHPLWEVLHALVTPTPRSPAKAHRWAYAPARDFLLRAGDLISAEQAERRVLILENPGMPGSSAATPSLYAGLQLILPGAAAPAHHHTQCALRFVMEGDGAFTAVDGERAVMRPFDLVLTPNWQWHDHGNDSGRPMIWLDGLDIPTVRFYDASFAERADRKSQGEALPAGDSGRRYGRNMRPFRATAADRATLDALLADIAADSPPGDRGTLRLTDPRRFGAVVWSPGQDAEPAATLLKTLAVPLIFFAILDALIRTSLPLRQGTRLLLICFANVTVAMAIGLVIMNSTRLRSL